MPSIVSSLSSRDNETLDTVCTFSNFKNQQWSPEHTQQVAESPISLNKNLCLFVLYSFARRCTYFDQMWQVDIGRPWRGLRYLKYIGSSPSLLTFPLGTLLGYGEAPELSPAFARIRGDTLTPVVTRIRGKLTPNETSEAATEETAVLGSLTSDWELDRSVGTATSYGVDGRGSSARRVKIFLLPRSSRPELGPTQPPMQWVPVAFPWG
jgi:hypothetical protein